jgi:hypothetical protein
MGEAATLRHGDTLVAFVLFVLFLGFDALVSTAADQPKYVTVAAGSHDRRGTLVSFDLPAGLRGQRYVLRDQGGAAVPLQIDVGRRAHFLLAEMKAGQTRKYRIEEQRRNQLAASSIQLIQERDGIRFTVAGTPVISYRKQTNELPAPDIKPIFRRGGYIHPVHTPSGEVVTDDYPRDHLHHHGVWFAWTKTEFEGRRPDFWNMGDGTGTVEFEALDGTQVGPVFAGLKARHRYVDSGAPAPKTVLNETWEIAVYALGEAEKPYRMFDLVSTQSCATQAPLLLPEYHYGGVGVRGRGEWNGKENCYFLTSEGKDRSNGHGTRARWCHIGGRVGNKLAGIAILCHPSNFRAPQPMRIHPTEPFFCYAPSQLGHWEIAPGKPYVSRYRFIVSDGPPDRAELDRLWNDYADPPRVTQ